MRLAIVTTTLALLGYALSASAEEQHLVAECDQGNAKACGFVGSHYHWGTGGFPQDHAKALEYQQRGCAGDDADSCFGAGLLLTGPDGTDGDNPEAMQFFVKACKLGNEYACAHQQPGG